MTTKVQAVPDGKKLFGFLFHKRIIFKMTNWIINLII